MRKMLSMAVVAMTVVGIVGLARAADPKSIKDVMKEAHGGGANSLRAKAVGAKGEKEDKEKLLALYKDLAANKPPKGDEKGWETKTKAIVAAAEALVKGDKGAAAKVNMTTNCAMCHKEHKP